MLNADLRVLILTQLSYSITEINAQTISYTVRISKSMCVKCGTFKTTGQRSCCARGGAWFKKCGDAGNMTSAHTWTEGIQICEGLSRSSPSKSSSQIMRGHVESVNSTISITTTRADAHHTMRIRYRDGVIPNMGSTDPGNCAVALVKVVVVCVLLA